MTEQHVHRSPVQLPDGTAITPVRFLGDDPYTRENPPAFGLYFDPAWAPPWPHEHLSWPDFGVPDPAELRPALDDVLDRARHGEVVEIGCLGGHGRTGTALACLAVMTGVEPDAAVDWVRSTYCPSAVETDEQRAFVEAFQLAGPNAVERALTTYYDQEAGARADRPLEAGRVEARSRFIEHLDGRSDRVLEVGPGAGRDSAAFVAAGMNVTGVDLSFQQLVHARAVGLRGAVASVRQLPFPDASFGALWTMSTLMHVPDAAIGHALGELRRVLAPGALAAIGVWGGPDIESIGDKDQYDPPRLFSRRSDDRWQSMLTTLGTIDEFENWHPDADDFWYQYALVTRH